MRKSEDNSRYGSTREDSYPLRSWMGVVERIGEELAFHLGRSLNKPLSPPQGVYEVKQGTVVHLMDAETQQTPRIRMTPGAEGNGNHKTTAHRKEEHLGISASWPDFAITLEEERKTRLEKTWALHQVNEKRDRRRIDELE